jgi:hypothetical protein
MKLFKLDDIYSVVCKSESTRYGFRHLAYLMKNGYEVCKTKACYYNRTWECYQFETVLKSAIDKYFDNNEEQRLQYREKIKYENLRNL